MRHLINSFLTRKFRTKRASNPTTNGGLVGNKTYKLINHRVLNFRKTDKSITYGTTSFARTYTIDQFKKQFPNSAKTSFALPQSLFETMTHEKGSNFEHFLLMRKSKDDPNATPMIEFTFDKGKLIYIFFVNF
jgi:hypothetical protein